ncbi:pantetheine-phosphate adenylyltransferase [Candidatus Palauibacter sp.]|uniref:pantetheine-phosphate adenylyltransferase n=1 Tax=Candidatus Palauibacter sp. TaxID=3101350 RepID=UPI003AF26CBC
MNKTTAVYPGSFDPLTIGHEDIVRRSLRIVDRLIVAVAETATQSKSGLFPIDERVDLIREVFGDEPRVEATSFSGLLVDFAQAREARVIIRGLRAVSDFEYEFQMALMNRSLWPEVEVLFMAPATRHTFLSSSLVREVGRLGGDVTDFVSPGVKTRMDRAFGRAARE